MRQWPRWSGWSDHSAPTHSLLGQCRAARCARVVEADPFAVSVLHLEPLRERPQDPVPDVRVLRVTTDEVEQIPTSLALGLVLLAGLRVADRVRLLPGAHVSLVQLLPCVAVLLDWPLGQTPR